MRHPPGSAIPMGREGGDRVMQPSFYLLGMSVVPGGARKDDEYVYNNLDDIDRALRADLTTFGPTWRLPTARRSSSRSTSTTAWPIP